MQAFVMGLRPEVLAAPNTSPRSLLRQLRSRYGETIRRDVPRILGMSLDPCEYRLGTFNLPRIDTLPHCLHEIFVLNRFSSGRVPVFLHPALIPHRYAVDGVLAVGDDLNILVFRRNLEGPQNRCEFGTLVRLGLPLESLGNVPGN